MVMSNDEREPPAAGPPIAPSAQPAVEAAPVDAASPEPASPALDPSVTDSGARALTDDGAAVSAPAPRPARATRRGQLPVTDIAATTCPYLVSERGAWRGISPSSDHRCAAETPPGRPSRDHQRAHCLSERFVACPLYPGIESADADTPGAATPVDAAAGGRWGLRPTAPIVIEGPPSSLDPRVLVRSRRLGAFALIALMIAAFALVAFARLPGLLPGGSTGSGTQPVTTAEATSGQPGGEATPSPATPGPSDGGGAASPTAPEPSPTGSVEAATATPAISPPSPTPIPSLTAAPSPQPTATTQTYVVQRGDTLSSIARQFDTTVDAIAAANGIANPSLIRPGQELIIP